ncbi:hypothetical protein E2C01_023898 [Portunus trituberculatus]|uniref:Uncharacterized protein n=1 Tax=Portunus trituberculatus TaxID=210409 RepID=A0A5B7E942_PORTR|nr:hypothetical protein [Portunus trituberculatus]
MISSRQEGAVNLDCAHCIHLKKTLFHDFLFSLKISFRTGLIDDLSPTFAIVILATGCEASVCQSLQGLGICMNLKETTKYLANLASHSPCISHVALQGSARPVKVKHWQSQGLPL